MVYIVQQIEMGELILVGITLIYVVLTFWLVKQNRKQTQIIIKQGKRERIIDLIQCILSPFINGLELNEKLFRTRNYNWYHSQKTKEIILRMNIYDRQITELKIEDERDKIIFAKFLKKYMDINKTILSYNEKMGVFKEKLLDLIKDIITPNFEKECYKLANQMSITNDYIPYSTVEWIIDNLLMPKESLEIKYGLSYSRELKNFYKEHGAKLFKKIKNNKKIINKKNEIITISKELENVSKKIRKQLIRTRENYGEEYYIPKKDYAKEKS